MRVNSPGLRIKECNTEGDEKAWSTWIVLVNVASLIVKRTVKKSWTLENSLQAIVACGPSHGTVTNMSMPSLAYAVVTLNIARRRKN
jgi:hypothetical protein